MIDLIVFDIDGSLTNGDITYLDKGIESKTFNVKDGLAISTWNKINGKKSAFITGRKSDIVDKRAKDLNISYVYQAIKNKKEILDKILAKENLPYERVAILGDDLNDYSMINTPCLSFCPKDASFYIKNIVDVVLDNKGGRGAGREMIEYLLKRDPNSLKQYLSFYISSNNSIS